MIQIAQGSADRVQDWNARDRSFLVDSEIKLHLADGRLAYEVVGVARYEKTYTQDEDSTAPTNSFVARLRDLPAGEIRLSHGWNGYAHIDDLVVARDFRRQGVATALVTQAIAWSHSEHLTGVMLETQSNNVPACRLYESCGFQLSGFDSDLYRALDPATQEVALFWY